MRVAVVVGTRPQFVKLRPLMAAKPEGVDVTVLHTGQHYSPEMGEPGGSFTNVIPEALRAEYGAPTLFDMGDCLSSEMAGPLASFRPDWALVIGDCRSTLAGALAAAEAGIPVAHLEAGLRCWAPTVEERIRRAVDHYSDLCLCPTRTAMDNLERERYAGRSVQVGDILVDALQGQRVLVTMHRAENEIPFPGGRDRAECETPLERVLCELEGHDATWVLHPRNEAMVRQILTKPYHSGTTIKLLPPQDPDAMLLLMARSAVVVTDSGGLSREASLLGKPVLMVRDIYEFVFELPGVSLYPPAKLGCAVGKRLERETPLGDGKTAARVWEEMAR